ncbi:MAG: hypothetical protein NVSMB57_12720 [Actinomycetota bacterium]
MQRLKIIDFRITDSILAQTDPNAGDVVYLGPHGTAAFPFVVWRKVSGPGGVYVDAFEIIAPDGTVEGPWERSYEVEGESWPMDIVTEVRGHHFKPGEYTLRFYEFDDKILDTTFRVVQEDPPYGVVVPGPVDAALSKSTLCWIRVPQSAGEPKDYGIWYGYENGRIYVLSGPGEQQLPGLATAAQVRVIVRSKDVQSRVGEMDCTVELLPKNAEWDRIAKELLIGRRLNLRDGEAAAGRWRKECEIAMLTPVATPMVMNAL